MAYFLLSAGPARNARSLPNTAQKPLLNRQELRRRKRNLNPENIMNVRLALVLTHDADFEKVVTESLKEPGTEILTTHDVDHALEIGCQRGAELDLTIIDRSDCHAITLLSALKACRRDLPVIVVTSSESCHCAAIAYAKGAAACLGKPVTAEDLKVVLNQLCEPKFKLAAV